MHLTTETVSHVTGIYYSDDNSNAFVSDVSFYYQYREQLTLSRGRYQDASPILSVNSYVTLLRTGTSGSFFSQLDFCGP